MSVVFWALTLLLLIKYTLVVLHADDQGNGGTFALYSILRRQGMAPPPAAPSTTAAEAAAEGTAAASSSATASRSSSAPVAASKTNSGGSGGGGRSFYQKQMNLDDSSDAAVSAGISTFARGPEARRASVDSGAAAAGGGGGGGGIYSNAALIRRRASSAFSRSSTMAAPSAAGVGGDSRRRASFAKVLSMPGAGAAAAAAAASAAAGASGGNGNGNNNGDVEAPPPPPPPPPSPPPSSLPKPASFSSSFAAKAMGAKKNAGKDWRQRLIEREGVQTVRRFFSSSTFSFLLFLFSFFSSSLSLSHTPSFSLSFLFTLPQQALKAMVVVGVGAILGDGVLTPSMSVVSAVEGLARPFPKAFAKGEAGVVGLAAGILSVLFLAQRFGTAGVAALFSPVAVAWCLALAGIGIYNLVIVPSSVALQALSAVSPHHAVEFFARNGAEGWRSLGSLALCITGAEALFADLGHFNRKSITLATTALVYPSLVLT